MRLLNSITSMFMVALYASAQAISAAAAASPPLTIDAQSSPVIETPAPQSYTNQTGGLDPIEKVPIAVEVVFEKIDRASPTIAAAGTLYLMVSQMVKDIKSLSNHNTCQATGNHYFKASNGVTYTYYYKAHTTGKNCDTTAQEKTIQSALDSGIDKLHRDGAVRGCIEMDHGGTWHGNLGITTDDDKYPARNACYF